MRERAGKEILARNNGGVKLGRYQSGPKKGVDGVKRWNVRAWRITRCGGRSGSRGGLCWNNLERYDYRQR